MNLKKIEKALREISKVISNDMLSDKEYLLLVANMLIAYGKSGIKIDDSLADINVSDASIIETALHQYPNNVYLASILQGHALIKWSDNVEE
jgi:hypothetical protein